jgi:hypothetical protein
MSWIQKELKRRKRKPAPATEAGGPSAEALRAGEEALAARWQKLEAFNDALPAELKLRRETVTEKPKQGPAFRVWLRSQQGASLGFTGDGVRYNWPVPSGRRSHNFWIGWDAQAGRLELRQRITPMPSPVIAHHRFDERRTELIIKQLVLGKRVAVRALRKKRLWLF